MASGATKYWTDERVQEVREMSVRLPIREVAKHYKVTRDAMAAVYQKNGIRIPKDLQDRSNDTRNRLSREEIVGIREHPAEKGLITKLGRKYKLSPSFVSQIRRGQTLRDIV